MSKYTPLIRLSKGEHLYLNKDTDKNTLQLICDGLIINRKQDNRLFLSAKGHAKVFDLLMTRNPLAGEACHAL